MRSAILGLLLGLAIPAGAAAQLRDPTIGSRALTDADMEKYVAISAELTEAKAGIREPSSAEGMAALRAATVKAAERQGWGTLDYGVVDARMTAAFQHIRMEATVPVPAEKKADVELARKWKAKIDAAKGRK
jgi:hypothetical protein